MRFETCEGLDVDIYRNDQPDGKEITIMVSEQKLDGKRLFLHLTEERTLEVASLLDGHLKQWARERGAS